MAIHPRLPVFHIVLDRGKTCRIIDGETNNPARDEHGDFLDGGGMANPLLAAAHAARINARRGVSNHQSGLLAQSYRRNVAGGSSPVEMIKPVSTEVTRGPRNECPIPIEHQTPIMSMKEMASIFGFSPDTLGKRIKAGIYTRHKDLHGSYVFDWSEFPPDVQAKLQIKFPQLAAIGSN